MIYICYMDCRNTLSYLQEVFPPAAGTCQELRSLVLTSSAVPCSCILNLGWSIYMFVCLLSTPTASNIATLTALSLSFSQLRPLPPTTHTYAPPAWKTNTFISYCICKTKKKNSHHPIPCRFSHLTVKFWVSWAGRSSHLSCLLTHVTNEKQDKRDFHIKGWRAHLWLLKQLVAMGSPECTCTDTYTCTHLAHRRKGLSKWFNLLYFTRFSPAPLLCQITLFLSTTAQPDKLHRVCTTQCVRANAVQQSPGHKRSV